MLSPPQHEDQNELEKNCRKRHETRPSEFC